MYMYVYVNVYVYSPTSVHWKGQETKISQL